MSEQRCGTCRWWLRTTPHYGDCTVRMPWWIDRAAMRGKITERDEGEDCETWEEKADA